MKETIHQTTLILDEYHGKDYYCDGDVEDELLKIVKEQDPKAFTKLIETTGSWPLFYHLNPVREHILKWYPFTEGSAILEIGSGCGAVSGSLCGNGNHVTCIDLSKKRSMINAYRHKNQPLQIHVGNFEDIHLEKTFDYVTMIGVLEYGGSYIHSPMPYLDFLKQAKQYLNDNGKLLIAIENKLGLKYFAGCKEDHVGKYFEGIEGYPATASVRTFSKKELREMLAAAGFQDIRFYYPYPDYKFAHTIYSDDYLPKRNDCGDNIRNFDMERMELFDENRVFNTLIENDLFPEFANSFFVEAALKPSDHPVIYTKFSQQNRAVAYQVKTSIYQQDHQRKVKKQALQGEGKAHILHMEKAYALLSKQYKGTRLSFSPCRIVNDEAVFAYVKGPSLEDILYDYAKKCDWKALISQIEDYFSVLFEPAYEASLASSPKRDELFGDMAGKQKVLANANVDAVFSNVKGCREYQMFDYEWVMDFEMPVDFIKYRCLFYFLQGNHYCKELDLFSLFHLSPEQIAVYEKAEAQFQSCIRNGKLTDHQMHTQLGQITIRKEDIIRISNQEKAGKSMQVYFDRGAGYQEATSVRIALAENGTHKRLCFVCDQDVKKVRIDPMEEYGIVHIEQLYSVDAGRSICKDLKIHTNGKVMKDRYYLFLTNDPMLEIVSHRLHGRQIVLEAEVWPLEQSIACWLSKNLRGSWKGGI